MIKAIVFDFDGVILESAQIKTETFADVVKDYPKEQADAFVAYHITHMGISRHVKFQYFIEEILKQPYSAEIEQKLANRFSEIAFSRIMECPFVPGAKAFLERNYKRYEMYIASGTPQEELGQIVEGRNLSQYFKKIYGTPMKKEEIVEDICRTYGYQKEEMVFVGDASTDKNAAKNTGLLFIGRNTEDNKEAFQDVLHRVDNLLQMEKIIEEM
ncbi:MAG: HAD family hydrolase [Lachnospiraceae bacterium]|jgi:phosphoglycolate phosphatase-like HAD superfamily hydrolase|nr:HAD family hydrolase [Lachnospiraceae bacterium]